MSNKFDKGLRNWSLCEQLEAKDNQGQWKKRTKRVACKGLH